MATDSATLLLSTLVQTLKGAEQLTMRYGSADIALKRLEELERAQQEHVRMLEEMKHELTLTRSELQMAKMAKIQNDLLTTERPNESTSTDRSFRSISKNRARTTSASGSDNPAFTPDGIVTFLKGHFVCGGNLNLLKEALEHVYNQKDDQNLTSSPRLMVITVDEVARPVIAPISMTTTTSPSAVAASVLNTLVSIPSVTNPTAARVTLPFHLLANSSDSTSTGSNHRQATATRLGALGTQKEPEAVRAGIYWAERMMKSLSSPRVNQSSLEKTLMQSETAQKPAAASHKSTVSAKERITTKERREAPPSKSTDSHDRPQREKRSARRIPPSPPAKKRRGELAVEPEAEKNTLIVKQMLTWNTERPSYADLSQSSLYLTLEGIAELEKRAPWNEMYQRRPKHSHILNFKTLQPVAKEWFKEALKVQFMWRRELWERLHWLPLSESVCVGEEWEKYRRTRKLRGQHAVRNWRKVYGDSIKLMEAGILPDDVWCDPVFWYTPLNPCFWLPMSANLLDELAAEDKQCPQRCYYTEDILQHPFYVNKLVEKYPKAYALPSIIPNQNGNPEEDRKRPGRPKTVKKEPLASNAENIAAVTVRATNTNDSESDTLVLADGSSD